MNDKAIAVACDNKKAYVWHFDEPNNIKEIAGNNEHLKTVTFSLDEDSKKLFTFGSNNILKKENAILKKNLTN